MRVIVVRRQTILCAVRYAVISRNKFCQVGFKRCKKLFCRWFGLDAKEVLYGSYVKSAIWLV